MTKFYVCNLRLTTVVKSCKYIPSYVAGESLKWISLERKSYQGQQHTGGVDDSGGGFEKYSGISPPHHLSVHTRPPEFFGIADAKFLVNMQIKNYLHRGRGI